MDPTKVIEKLATQIVLIEERIAMSSSEEEEFTMEDEVIPPKKRKQPVKAESEDDSDDDVPLKQMKKKRKKEPEKKKKRPVKEEKVQPAKKKKKAVKPDEAKSTTTSSRKPPKALKKLDKTERLQYAMQSFLWWDAVEPPEGCQWRTMEHAGVSFPEEYVPHGVKMKYDGKDVDLTPAQEEAATFFAAMDPEGMHLGDPKTAKIFIKNYFADFKAVLGRGHIIKVSDQQLADHN